MDGGRLAISVTHADGRVTRWSAEEVDAGDVPNDLGFSTSVPGGFRDAQSSLIREIEPRSDEALLDDLRIYGPGGQTAWQGRIAQMPRAGGRQATLSPGAVGWSAHLEDDSSFREVYVDSDPGSWSDASLARRIVYGLANQPYGSDYTSTVGGGGIGFNGVTDKSIPAGSGSELWYKLPPGNGAAFLEYKGTQQNATNVLAPAAYWDDNDSAASPASAGLLLNGAMQTATLGAQRYVFLIAQASATHTPGAAAPYALSLTEVAVYGAHGLPLHTTVAGRPDGVYASDVVADVISRVCPLLTYSTGSTGTIQPTTFTIPHLVFQNPTTAAEVISTVNAYHAYDWAVWEDRGFYFTPPGAGIEWQARVADGAQLSLEGDTAEQLINGVIVSYTDGGITKLAGPTGSGCDVTSASLQDDAIDNPVNAHGIPRRWPVLPISFPTTDAGAIELGAIYLSERNLAARKGQITLQGTVRHPTEGMVPVWRVRAGDSIVVTDKTGDVSRRIISTSYSHATRTLTVDCNTTSAKLDALLERLALVTGALHA